MNEDKRERLNKFLYSLAIEVLREIGLLEDGIEDEQKIKEMEKLVREEFSDDLIKVRQRTAGWILRLFDNGIGKIVIKIWIYKQFKKAIVEQLKEAGNFLEGVKKGFEEREEILHEWMKDLDQIEREIYEKEKPKTTIH